MLIDVNAEERTREVAATLIGLDETAAVAAAERVGITTRVALRDGTGMSLRRDRRSSRINLSIKNGRVVATSVG